MNLVTRDYQGHAIVLQDDGWFNATQAAAQMGRRVDHWLANQETKDYIAALVEITNTPFPGYLKTKRGAAGGRPRDRHGSRPRREGRPDRLRRLAQ